jgi:hypothetical protein
MAATSRETESMITRVSPELKQQVIESADHNKRSLAREIEYQLAYAYRVQAQPEAQRQ